MYKRLAKHHQICCLDFVQQTFRMQKIQPLFQILFSKNFFSRPNLLWSKAITVNVIKDQIAIFVGAHIRLLLI